ncbi:MAG: hypothetical protein RLZZ450_222 [Pseudomonadota bacterium]|jgi:hypothetical protein
MPPRRRLLAARSVRVRHGATLETQEFALSRPSASFVSSLSSSAFARGSTGALVLGLLSCGQPDWSREAPASPSDAGVSVEAGRAGGESGKVDVRDGGSVPRSPNAIDASSTDPFPQVDAQQRDPTPDCTGTPSACQSPCAGASCRAACVAGARRCAEGNVSERCDNGSWKTDKACPFSCGADGLCTGECKPGTTECTPSSAAGGSGTRSCNDDARWAEPTPCRDQTCAKGACIGECEVGRTRCSVIGAGETCAANGQWVNGSASPCDPVPNYALGAVVEASSSAVVGTWSEPGLVDGRADTGYSTAVRAAPSGGNVDGCADWVSVTMPNNVTFSKVVLTPRTDPGNVGSGFPRAFKIELWDGQNWVFRVNARPSVVRPATPQVYTWGQSDKTFRVRICATELGVDDHGSYLMQFAELMILP